MFPGHIILSAPGGGQSFCARQQNDDQTHARREIAEIRPGSVRLLGDILRELVARLFGGQLFLCLRVCLSESYRLGGLASLRQLNRQRPDSLVDAVEFSAHILR